MFKKEEGKVKMSGSVSPETTGYAAYSFVLPFPVAIGVCGKEIIKASGLPCFVAAHWWEDEPHYHVMVLFDESREAAPVFRLCKALMGYALEPVCNVRGFARYMCHLDSLDRHQYSPDDVKCFNGCIYEEFIK